MPNRPILVVVGLKREARAVEGAGLATLAGGGAGGLAARIAAAIDSAAPEAIVSFGLAGALAPSLAPGDLVVGRSVSAGDTWRPCHEAWTQALAARLAGAVVGDVLGLDRMVVDAGEKQALHLKTGAVIVDMESAAVARAATQHSLPFAVIRAVSDSADQTLPPAVLNGMTPDGGMDLGGVLASLARDPRQLPALIRTGREAERGFKALDNARRLLGPRLGRLDLGELLLDVR